MRHDIVASVDEPELHWLELRARMGVLAELFAELRLAVTVADACAALDVTGRGELSRELVRRRLPPFRLLKNWFQVVEMARRAERGSSLCSLALSRGEYPAAYYRLVSSTTGHSWTEVQSRGLAWVERLALQAWAPYTRFHDSAESRLEVDAIHIFPS